VRLINDNRSLIITGVTVGGIQNFWSYKMHKLTLAAILAASTIIVSGQASAAPRHHHKPICHTDHHKVKVHGKWIVKTIRVCK
jgi:hypothetical protein